MIVRRPPNTSHQNKYPRPDYHSCSEDWLEIHRIIKVHKTVKWIVWCTLIQKQQRISNKQWVTSAWQSASSFNFPSNNFFRRHSITCFCSELSTEHSLIWNERKRVKEKFLKRKMFWFNSKLFNFTKWWSTSLT